MKPMIIWWLCLFCGIIRAELNEAELDAEEIRFVGARSLSVFQISETRNQRRSRVMPVMIERHHWVILYFANGDELKMEDIRNFTVTDATGVRRVPEFLGRSSELIQPRALDIVTRLRFQRTDQAGEESVRAVAYLLPDSEHTVLTFQSSPDAESRDIEYRIHGSDMESRRLEREERQRRRRAPLKPTPRPEQRPSPPPFEIEGEWVSAPVNLDEILGVNQEGDMVFELTNPFRYVVFDPEEKKFRGLGASYAEEPQKALAGNYFVSRDSAGDVRVWDVRTGKPAGRFFLNPEHNEVTGLIASPVRSDRLLAVYSEIVRGSIVSMQLVDVSLPNGRTGHAFPITPHLFYNTGGRLGKNCHEGHANADFSYVQLGRMFLQRLGTHFSNVSPHVYPFYQHRADGLHPGLRVWPHGDALRPQGASNYFKPDRNYDFYTNWDNNRLVLGDSLTGEYLGELGLLPFPNNEKRLFRHSLANWHLNLHTGLFVYAEAQQKDVFVGKVDLFAALKRAEQAPVWVLNPPASPAVPGEEWRYTPELLLPENSPEPTLIPLFPEGLRVENGNELVCRVPDQHVGRLDLRYEIKVGEASREARVVAPPGNRSQPDGPVSRRLDDPTWGMPHVVLELDGTPDSLYPLGEDHRVLCRVPASGSWWTVDLLTQGATRLPLSPGSGPGAAGGDVVAVYDSGVQMIKLFQGGTGKQIRQFPNPLSSPPVGILMGEERGDALVLVEWMNSSGNRGEWRLHWMDLKSGRTEPLDVVLPGSRKKDAPSNWKASPRLDLVVGQIYTHPGTLAVVQRDARGWTSRVQRANNSPHLLAPSKEYFVSGDDFYDNMFTPIPPPGLTGTPPSYTTGLQPARTVPLWMPGRIFRDSLVFRSIDDHSPLFEIEVPQLFSFGESFKENSLFSRLHMDWESRRLLYALPQKPGVLLMELDAAHLIGKAPPVALLPGWREAVPGETFRHKVEAFSAGNKPTFSLGKAPDGVTVDQEGWITWAVPESFSGSQTLEVIITDSHDRRVLRELDIRATATRSGGSEVAAGLETDENTRVLGRVHPVFAGSPGSEWLVLATERNLQVFEADTMRAGPLRKAAVPEAPRHIAVRGDSLFVQSGVEIHEFALPSLRLVQKHALDMEHITALAAPPGTRRIFFAGETGRHIFHRVGMLDPRTGQSGLLDGVVGTCIVFSEDLSFLVTALNHTTVQQDQQWDMFGFPHPMTVTVNRNRMGVYKRMGHGFVAERQVHLGVSPVRLSASAGFGRVTVTGARRHEDGSVRIDDLVHFHATSLETVSIDPTFTGKIAGWAEHPSLDASLLWGSDRLAVHMTDKNETHAIDINPGIDRILQAFWLGKGEHLLIVGELPDGQVVTQKFTTADLEIQTPLPPMFVRDPDMGTHPELRPAPTLHGEHLLVSSHAQKPLKEALQSLVKISNKVLAWPDVAGNVRESIVEIRSADGMGTGFVLGDKGLIMTCDHVLPPTDGGFVIRKYLQNGKVQEFRGEILARDPDRDVALVRPDAEVQWVPLPVAFRLPVQMGMEVAAIGHAGTAKQVLTHTMTTGLVSFTEREMDGRKLIQFSASVNPGVSGGPLLDRRGNVVGMVSSKVLHAEGLGFAIPAAEFMRSLVESEQQARTLAEENP